MADEEGEDAVAEGEEVFLKRQDSPCLTERRLFILCIVSCDCFRLSRSLGLCRSRILTVSCSPQTHKKFSVPGIQPEHGSCVGTVGIYFQEGVKKHYRANQGDAQPTCQVIERSKGPYGPSRRMPSSSISTEFEQRKTEAV